MGADISLSSIDPRVRQAEGIKSRLAERGYSLSFVDERFGLTPSSATNALRRPHGPAEAAIAELLGVKPASLWPERYSATGERLRPQPSRNYLPLPALRQRRKSTAPQTRATVHAAEGR